ncbi:MAG TPA: PIN domain-containing protein [Flavobacteriales bacterium]|nr:PIN domain-containing protein [Flavobacteriales bacterium]
MRSVFLDTSVIADQYFREKADNDPAIILLDRIQQGELEGWTSAQCILTTMFFMENARDRKGARKFSQKRIIEDMERLLSFVELIEVHAGHFGMAFRSGWPDLEDAVLYAAADSSGKVDAVINEDRRGFRQAKGIPVFTCAEFIREAKNDGKNK